MLLIKCYGKFYYFYKLLIPYIGIRLKHEDIIWNEKGRTRREMQQSLQFRKGCKIALPCEIACHCSLFPAAFYFLILLSPFGFLPDLSPFVIVFGWLFWYFVMGFSYKSPKTRHCRGLFSFIANF